ncbi:hypothetical protein [Alkaliphilus sp. B6464]|uniref:hypothetical protein n=1 Tax=Alkaliphilus sp. B6464 TaxID=2731219 RepID=UPI001BA5DF86|nr:hypothetical protein [Alkaliphilus sp. B6464]QUH22042.1 hypothetical protein HYG84_19240 [Alkaliphilus sp. B6464]
MLQNYRDILIWPNNLENEVFIIHNDIDGFICGMFIHNRGGKIGGIYDLSSFYFTKYDYLLNIEKLIGIDLDIDYKDMRCFGHHITADINKNGFNINNFMNLDINTKEYFNSKCPLNTIILLYSLFNLKPKTDEEIAMLVYPDSVINNYDKFKDNVTNWLVILEQTEILDALQNRKDKILEIIDKKIVATVKGVFPHSSENSQNINGDKRIYPQCNNYINYSTKNFNYDASILINMIDQLMGWKTENFPMQFKFQRRFYKHYIVKYDEKKGRKVKNNQIIEFDKDELLNVKDRLLTMKDILVSHSFTYSGGLQITTTEDVFVEYNQNKKEFDIQDRKGKIITVKDKNTGKIAAYQVKTTSLMK